MRWELALLFVLGCGSVAGADDLSYPLVFHASFDGTLDAVARGAGNPIQVDGPIIYRPGRVGQALQCGEGGASITYSAGQNLRASGGTVEMWVCPLDRTGAEEEFHVFLEATNPGWLEQATDTRVRLVGHAEATGLQMSVRHTVEFDGFTWTDLTIEPADPMPMEELRITWTMPQPEAALLHADAMRWIDNPAGRLEPQGWASPLTPFFWLGNEQRGLAWYTESDQYWRAAKDRPTIQVVPEGDQVRVIVRLVAKTSNISGRLEYGFGMMATPVRPQPADARRWRMMPGVRPSLDIVWPNGAMKWHGYPEPADAQPFSARVQAAHEQATGI